MVLSVLALVLCGCGFNYDKEDLSKYVELADYKNFTYADFEKRYEEYRKNYAEEIKAESLRLWLRTVLPLTYPSLRR